MKTNYRKAPAARQACRQLLQSLFQRFDFAVDGYPQRLKNPRRRMNLAASRDDTLHRFRQLTRGREQFFRADTDQMAGNSARRGLFAMDAKERLEILLGQ